MLLDWFTVAAQLINFLILLYLLQRFLYGPIVKAMEQREQRIAARMSEANERRAAAERAEQEHSRQRRELEAQREQLLVEARHEAAARRHELIQAAREEVEALKRSWHASLRHGREAFLRELRLRAGEQVADAARRVLHDLADVELEQRIVAVFVKRLRRLAADEREPLRRALAEAQGRPEIASAFELAAAQREQLRAALRPYSDDLTDMRFTQNPALVCGITLTVGGHEITWSIQSYLETLEGAIARMLEEAGQERGLAVAE